MSEANKGFEAVVTSKPSKEMIKKVNGHKYVLINCKATEGIFKNFSGQLPAMLTTVGKDGKVTDVPAEGETVVLYHETLPSITEPGKVVHFFSMGLSKLGASQDEISAYLESVSAPAGNQVM